MKLVLTIRYIGLIGRSVILIAMSFGTRSGKFSSSYDMPINQAPVYSQSAGKFCSKCGTSVPAGTKFCVKCGNKME